MYTSLQGKNSLRDVRLGNTLFPEVQRRDLDKAVILAATAKVNWSGIFLKSCHLSVAGSKHGKGKMLSKGALS